MPIDEAALERSLRRLRQGISADAHLDGTSAGRLRQVLEVMSEVLALDSIGVLLLDDDDALRCVASVGAAAAALEKAQEQHGVGPGIDTQRLGRTVAVADLGAVGGYAALLASLGQVDALAVLSVPVWIDGQVVGNLNAWAPAPRDWGEQDRRAVEAFADVVALLLTLSAPGSRGRANEREV